MPFLKKIDKRRARNRDQRGSLEFSRSHFSLRWNRLCTSCSSEKIPRKRFLDAWTYTSSGSSKKESERKSCTNLDTFSTSEEESEKKILGCSYLYIFLQLKRKSEKICTNLDTFCTSEEVWEKDSGMQQLIHLPAAQRKSEKNMYKLRHLLYLRRSLRKKILGVHQLIHLPAAQRKSEKKYVQT